jgi:hypothetical protein
MVLPTVRLDNHNCDPRSDRPTKRTEPLPPAERILGNLCVCVLTKCYIVWCGKEIRPKKDENKRQQGMI